MNILAISWAMPPLVTPRSINVARSLAVLAERGWAIEVLAAELPPEERKPFAWDDALAEKYREAFTVRYLPYNLSSWENEALAAARESIRRRPPHALITFAQPFSDFVIGLKLKHMFPRLPWVAHFSDPWVDNPYSAPTPAEFTLERLVLERADAAVFITTRARNLVMGKYPKAWAEKCFVIPHGFDEVPRSPARRPPDEALHLVHTGDVYGKRIPYALLEALVLAGREQPGAYTVSFIGRVDAAFIGKANSRRLKKSVTFYQPTTPAAAKEYALEADVLLLCDAPAPESVFLPSKLVDYLPLGLPILALTPKCGATADVLAETGGVCVDPEDIEGQLAALRMLKEAKSRGELHNLAPSLEAARQFSIAETSKNLIKLLEAVYSEDPARMEESVTVRYICPKHNSALSEEAGTTWLRCPQGCAFPVVDGIPRFAPVDNYASSFGLQWNSFRKTQLDSFTGAGISRDRLSRILGGLDWLRGKAVLEAGCGAGRFSEVLLEAGAELHSLDISNAVDAARANCAHFPNHQVCQASILALPFPPEKFDAVVCVGVIQHTPNPEETIAALARMVKPGGGLFIDHYAPGYPMPPVRQTLRRFLRPKTPEYRMRFCAWLRNLLWPLHALLHARRENRLAGKGYRLLFRLSPLVDYQEAYPELPPEVLREWALLDMHDLLTDTYKHLRTVEQIGQALADNGLEVTRCVYAGNGVEAAARKPFPEQA